MESNTWSISHLIPRGIRSKIRSEHRKIILRRNIKKLSDSNDKIVLIGEIFNKLSYGWNNAGWCADVEYMTAIASAAEKTAGPILECGSGLSSIILGAILKSSGKTVYALENNEMWADKVRTTLDELGLMSVKVIYAPLLKADSYEWYQLPANIFPSNFSMVICDGPPGDTYGGRAGLLDEMQGKLVNDCVIYVDDIERAAEHSMVKYWVEKFGGTYEITGAEKPYAVYILSDNRSNLGS